jgi:hypothetical protein
MNRQIIQPFGDYQGLVSAECGDVILLTVEITSIMGVDLQLFGDIRSNSLEVRPDHREPLQIHPGQR